MSDSITDPDRSTAHNAVRRLPLVGACVACCVPMLVLLGAVSLGAALAGLVGLAAVIAVVAAAVVWVPGLRRRH